MNVKTAIYARQSLDKSGEGTAVGRQLTECRRLAKSQGLPVAVEFVDNDVSATKGTRPEFARMLSLVRAGEINTIITWHTDRLYRRLRDLVDLVELAENNPIRILTVKAGDIDLSTPSGRMSAGMLGQVARYEVEQKGARQAAANEQRAGKGVWGFSNRPYGYERIDGQVRVLEDEAAVIREAYERFLAGETLYGITQSLNNRDITTTTGRPWSVSTLSARLANPAYAGIKVYRGEEMGQGDWEPIVSRETWSAFKTTRNRRRKPENWTNRAKYLLSGIALCGVCGGRLLARPSYPKKGVNRAPRIAYTCTDKWCVQRDQERLDALIEGIVIARMSQPDVKKLLRPKLDVAPLMAEADELRQRRDDLASLLADGVLMVSAVRQESARLSKTIGGLEQRIRDADDADGLSDLLSSADTKAAWDELTLGKRRAVVSALMSVHVDKQKNTRVFDPEDVTINWRS